MTFFSANRVVIEVNAAARAWLYYADAFHPSWRATVNSHPAVVLRANVGFKAVEVDKGISEVVFEFKDEARDRLRTVLYSIGVMLGLALLAGMAIGPWFLTASPTAAEPLLPATEGRNRMNSIKVWCGTVLLSSLGCGLWVGFGLNMITVGILVLAFIVVVAVSRRDSA